MLLLDFHGSAYFEINTVIILLASLRPNYL